MTVAARKTYETQSTSLQAVCPGVSLGWGQHIDWNTAQA